MGTKLVGSENVEAVVYPDANGENLREASGGMSLVGLRLPRREQRRLSQTGGRIRVTGQSREAGLSNPSKR